MWAHLTLFITPLDWLIWEGGGAGTGGEGKCLSFLYEENEILNTD